MLSQVDLVTMIPYVRERNQINSSILIVLDCLISCIFVFRVFSNLILTILITNSSTYNIITNCVHTHTHMTTTIDLIHAGTGYAAIDAANNEAGERDTQLYGLGVRGLFRQRQQTQSSSSSSSLPVPPQQPFRGHRWKMERLQPTNRTQFVYGASLTPLPTIYHRHRHQKSQQESKGQNKHKQKKGIGDDNNNDKDKNSIDYDGSQHQHQHQKSSKTVVLSEMRALRFGGFRAGGYSNETSAVSLLSIKEVMNDDLGEEEQQEPSSSRRHRLTGFPGRFFRRHQNQQQHSSTSWVAEWTDISCSSFPRNSDNSMSIDDDNDDLDKDNLSRAYHSATLILNRYLLVIGGMKCTL